MSYNLNKVSYKKKILLTNCGRGSLGNKQYERNGKDIMMEGNPQAFTSSTHSRLTHHLYNYLRHFFLLKLNFAIACQFLQALHVHVFYFH